MARACSTPPGFARTPRSSRKCDSTRCVISGALSASSFSTRLELEVRIRHEIDGARITGAIGLEAGVEKPAPAASPSFELACGAGSDRCFSTSTVRRGCARSATRLGFLRAVDGVADSLQHLADASGVGGALRLQDRQHILAAQSDLFEQHAALGELELVRRRARRHALSRYSSASSRRSPAKRRGPPLGVRARRRLARRPATEGGRSDHGRQISSSLEALAEGGHRRARDCLRRSRGTDPRRSCAPVPRPLPTSAPA